MKCPFCGDLRDGHFNHLGKKKIKKKTSRAQTSPFIVHELKTFLITLALAVREETLSLITVLFSYLLIFIRA